MNGLSKRLQMLADFARPGSVVADVGTDHGYLPIYLVENKICPRALGMDINVGPLEKAREHVGEAGLSASIELRLSDGLEKLAPGEAEGVIISGMGGALVLRILEASKEVVDALDYLILQPQSELKKVRERLADLGLMISDEGMVEEAGKFYTALFVEKGPEKTYSSWEHQYGPCLLQEKNETLYTFLQKEKQLKEQISSTLTGRDTPEIRARQGALKAELQDIKEALQYYL
ncbi:tRNA (adenine(22)-N(1))-methyltransferase [Ohessyouella blattaphilus]|uniref:Class I SAM-dependent methyltransferase n=1 Tax=Ohessyouella blattaphilus TaxID=2949333 RepID=A0ABT1EFG3_9FIRM|nr:class I SAM-dependent methyltransferase [Ohessyouella blattaphilus]MCP1109451.1 class I SAM-dependent methyltransferase [Ohessyouella blattaphilus]MCR8562845.1 class I SAM-dependent methyltransferase [Ohessyouella blattaphilus]